MRKQFSKLEKLEWNVIAVILLALLMIAMMSGFMDRYGAGSDAEAAAAASEENSYEGIIRFHVRANSDSREDQELKLKVRDAVMTKIQSGLMDEFAREIEEENQLGINMTEQKRLEITRIWLTQHSKQIEDWALETIRDAGKDYTVKASLGVTWIPERQYDGIYFPAGNYEALTLDIGEGAGENWWCVIFPPLCLIDSGNVSEEDLDAWIASLAGDRIVLKSRILELLRKSGH